MSERPAMRLPLREIALIVTLVGMAFIALAGARGPRALIGFALFCFGIAMLDAVFRGYVGFRHVALFLGIAAVGLGFWTVTATGLLVLLEMRVPAHMRTLLVVSAGLAAGSAAMALVAVKSPGWIGTDLARWIGGLVRRNGGGPSRPGEQPRDRRLEARQPLRPAGPVQGG